MRTRPRPEDPGHEAVPGASPLRVTVVESEACHFCADAQQVLTDAATSYPVEVWTVDVRSAEGAELMQAHRATMSPLVLLDGQYFSNGRLPRRKLAKVLRQRFTGATEAGNATALGGGDHG